MAEADAKLQPEAENNVCEDEEKLRYLDFVQVAAIYVVLCLYSIYEYAKECSGPLKPGVENVEDTVKTVVGPVYEKFRDVPLELLKFIDIKVEELLNEVSKYVPSLVKQASSHARALATEVHRVGVVDAAKGIARSACTKYEPAAKELYWRYEPVAQQYAVSTWRSLNQYSIFHQVCEIVVPTAAYWSDKYNRVVCSAGEKDYTVATYLPLIPIERIEKVFGESEIQ